MHARSLTPFKVIFLNAESFWYIALRASSISSNHADSLRCFNEPQEYGVVFKGSAGVSCVGGSCAGVSTIVFGISSFMHPLNNVIARISGRSPFKSFIL